MSTIREDSGLATMINVFTTTPETQQAVLKIITEATDQYVAKMPGFHSANIHASADGLRVVNYAQWSDPEAWKAMMSDPECSEHINQLQALAELDYHLYDVVSVHEAP
jgi:quinol monooxygenase YgiN